jgi:hypothetical protein
MIYYIVQGINEYAYEKAVFAFDDNGIYKKVWRDKKSDSGRNWLKHDVMNECYIASWLDPVDHTYIITESMDEVVDFIVMESI